MTRNALAAYCTDLLPCSEDDFLASPGPICLYECRGYRVTGLDLDASRSDDETIHVQVSVAVKKPGAAGQNDAFSSNESLTVGAGTPLGGTARRPLVIIEATTSA